MASSLQQTLEKFKAGDHRAFEHIYRKYASKVFLFARKYLKSAEDAEETVQEVFVRLWDARELVQSEAAFDNYLFTITRNLIFNLHRHKVNETYLRTVLLAGIEQDACRQEEEMMAQDLSQYIDRVVEQLPAKQREIFNLSRKQLLTHREIAEKLGISEKTVEAHIHRVLKILRRHSKD
ncbi:MAG: RNA polymerase sigma-70 factor [Bacteroidales bacterium]|jgi:RNA polymerase sigma-70 factor (ECF subfamily)|nr:RNA polymerase sigma-70 factor [Bacteroidales bacterium]